MGLGQQVSKILEKNPKKTLVFAILTLIYVLNMANPPYEKMSYRLLSTFVYTITIVWYLSEHLIYSVFKMCLFFVLIVITSAICVELDTQGYNIAGTLFHMTFFVFFGLTGTYKYITSVLYTLLYPMILYVGYSFYSIPSFLCIIVGILYVLILTFLKKRTKVK